MEQALARTVERAGTGPPVDRKTGKRHIYLRLDRYVQSVLQRQMRREAGLPGTEKG